jgi:hypothetical protein
MMMAQRRAQPLHTVEVDAAWLAEWIAYGFKELEVFLAHHAAFDQWCLAHHREAN